MTAVQLQFVQVWRIGAVTLSKRSVIELILFKFTSSSFKNVSKEFFRCRSKTLSTLILVLYSFNDVLLQIFSSQDVGTTLFIDLQGFVC